MGGKGNRHRGDPLAMLDRSHRKLEERLAALRTAANAIASDAASADDLLVVVESVEFFEHQVTRHEADEEDSLFPRLRGQPAIDLVIDTLTEHHRDHNRLHRRLREITESWAGSPPTATQGAHLQRVVGELEQAYAQHIALEEDRLLPAARESLAAAELAAVAAEMQARRGRPSA